MNLKFFIAMATAIVLSAGTLSAQENVSGVVKDRNGEPLIGANVVVKGTTLFTITGINGEFNIKAADDAVLVITFDGYQPMEVAVADLPTANLQLKPESLNGLETFYGNDNYYALTTASTLIVVDDISTGLEVSIQDFLLGRVPGLEVIDGQYRLRGGNSLTGWDDASPLFVVDGVYDLYANTLTASLNPDDVESIRVMKDAAATAQYGEIAKGGAIVIKTRRPSNKELAVSYDGNASFNTPSGKDSKWEPFNSIYDNSMSTKHNVRVSGVAADLLPYRATLGYNAINGIVDSDETDIYSASLWVGPRLLDRHLSIDVNGAFRKVDYYNGDQKWLSGAFNADYTVHSLEFLHLNLRAGANTNLDGFKTILLDGNVSLEHQFGKRHYLELRGGAAYNSIDLENEDYDVKSLYGQFNMAISRFYMNAYTCLNIYSEYEDYSKLSAAVSFGVKPANAVTLRTGLGFLGAMLGDAPAGHSDLSTFTYNLGVDAGTAKSRINGSADFYFQHNGEAPIYSNSEEYLNSMGAELRLNLKLIDDEDIKFHIGGNLAANVSFEIDENGDGSNADEGVYVSIGGYYLLGGESNTDNLNVIKPYTYGVFDPVYDQDGNLVPGLFVDYDGDGRFSVGDCISSDRSPVPSVIGGFHTYLEVKGIYLQANAHTSLNRHNVTGYSVISTTNDEFGWTNEPTWTADGSRLNFDAGEYLTTDNISNSSFFRIDDVVLGYKFNNLWKLSGRAYFAVQNPAVFTEYDGREPELYDGVDFSYALRRPTTFTIGVKLNINIKD